MHNDYTLIWRTYPNGKRVVFYYAYDDTDVRQGPWTTKCQNITAARSYCNRLIKTNRLMRENGLNARGRRKFIVTTNSRHGLPVCDNILNREFQAEQAGTKWVSDITYLRTEGGWVFLTVVLDLYDRKVIGWAFSDDMESVHTTIPAVEMAFGNRKAQEGLIFHSDRGVQYCAKSFRDRLAELGPTVRRA